MNKIEPTEFQRRVLTVPEHVNLLLSGGRGGGKSMALMLLTLRHCVTYKSRAKVLIVRKQLKSLAQMSVQLLGLFRSAYGRDVSYNGGTNMFTLPDGATVQLAYCDGAADLVSISQGMSFSAIFVDEAGSAPAIEVIDELALALRADPDVPTRLALFANPAGVNHATLFSRYLRGRTPWQVFEYADELWCVCPSTLDMNPHVGKKYAAKFEILRKTNYPKYLAMRHGDFSRLTGDFFGTCWDHDRIVFDANELTPDCFSTLRLAIDHGSSAPMVALLLGRTREDLRLRDDRFIPAGAYVVWDEVAEYMPDNPNKGTGRSPREYAPRIKDMCCRSGLRRASGVIDSAASSKHAGRNEKSISDLYHDAGIFVRNAKKGNRVERHENLKQLIVDRRLFVADRCRYFLETVPTLPADPKNFDDTDPAAPVHALDALEYGVAGPQTGQVRVDSFSGRPPRMPDTGNRVILV
jgi:hypothetical protein